MVHKERVIEVGQADTSFNFWSAFDDNGTKEVEQRKWEAANKKIAADRQKSQINIKPWWQFW